MRQLADLVNKRTPGDKVKITYYRGDAQEDDGDPAGHPAAVERIDDGHPARPVAPACQARLTNRLAAR